MKKLSIALILVGLIAAALPFVTGYLAEGENRRMVSVLNHDQTANGRIDIDSYDRGYMSSQVEYKYQLPAQLQTALQMSKPVKLSCAYQHGLGSINYACSLSKNELYTSFLNDYLGGKDPLSITGSASPFGALEQVIQLDALSAVIPDGGNLSIQASELVARADKAMTTFDVTSTIGDIEMVSPDATFVVSGSKLTGSLTAIGGGIYTGDTKMNIDSVDVKSTIRNMTLSNFEFASDVQEVDEAMELRFNYKVDSLSLGAQGSDAEALAINDTEVSMDIIGLNTQAMIAYQDWARDMQAAMTNTDGQADALAMPDVTGVIQILNMALIKGLQFDLKGSGKLNGGDNSLTLGAELIEDITLQEMQSLMVNPDSVFKRLAINLDMTLDKSMVESSASGAAISQNPLFQSSQDGYTSQLKLGPISSLNGKVTSVSEIIGMLMPAPQLPPHDNSPKGSIL